MSVVNDYKNMKDKEDEDGDPALVTLFGFSSTTLSREVAERFTNRDNADQKTQAVLFEIEWDDEWDHYVCDKGAFGWETEYEVLLYDGTQFQVTDWYDDTYKYGSPWFGKVNPGEHITVIKLLRNPNL